MGLPDMPKANAGRRAHFRANAKETNVQIGPSAFVSIRPTESPAAGCGWMGSNEIYVRVGDRMYLANGVVRIHVKNSGKWPHDPPELGGRSDAEDTLTTALHITGDAGGVAVDLAEASRRLAQAVYEQGQADEERERSRQLRNVETQMERWHMVAVFLPAFLLLGIAGLLLPLVGGWAGIAAASAFFWFFLTI